MRKFLDPGVEPRKYREKAAECRRLAAATDHPEVAQAYLDLAAAQEAFAARIERTQRQYLTHDLHSLIDAVDQSAPEAEEPRSE